jgi:hypothetical protein
MPVVVWDIASLDLENMIINNERGDTFHLDDVFEEATKFITIQLPPSPKGAWITDSRSGLTSTGEEEGWFRCGSSRKEGRPEESPCLNGQPTSPQPTLSIQETTPVGIHIQHWAPPERVQSTS